jgi:hypothetical protein
MDILNARSSIMRYPNDDELIILNHWGRRLNYAVHWILPDFPNPLSANERLSFFEIGSQYFVYSSEYPYVIYGSSHK